MNACISLLMFLPFIEIITGTIARKHKKIHEGVICLISITSLIISIKLPISSDIYFIDFGIIKLSFMCDIYAYVFGILVNIVWILTNLYSYSYATLSVHKHKINDFFKHLSLSIFAVFGICYAGDLITVIIFSTLLTLITAPLITQNGTKEAIRTRNLYVITHLGTTLLFFIPAVFLVWHYTGNVAFTHNGLLQSLENDTLGAIILMLFIFGVSKNCIIPFHSWIIRTTIAPTPVSSLLHSVAAVKSGSIIILKIVIYTFGTQYIQHLTSNFFTGGWIFYLCGFTALYAAWKAWKTKVVKHRFAYSTISQLSYILSSFMIATPMAIMAGTLHIVSHSICKIVLFYIAGIFSAVYGFHSTGESAKLAPHIKIWIGCLAFCGASIIGFPFLPGSFGKDYMIIADWKTHHYASILFLVIGSLINILYIYPIVKAGFFTKNPVHIEKKRIPLTMRIAIISGVCIAISMSIFIDNIVNFFTLYA